MGGYEAQEVSCEATVSRTMFGVDLCECDEDMQERELVKDVVFCANCHGVVALTAVFTDHGVVKGENKA